MPDCKSTFFGSPFDRFEFLFWLIVSKHVFFWWVIGNHSDHSAPESDWDGCLSAHEQIQPAKICDQMLLHTKIAITKPSTWDRRAINKEFSRWTDSRPETVYKGTPDYDAICIGEMIQIFQQTNQQKEKEREKWSGSGLKAFWNREQPSILGLPVALQ